MLFCRLTFSVHVGIQVQFSNIVARCGLDPDTLPDTTAGRIEDVGRIQSLLADGDHVWIAVRWVESEDEPFEELATSHNPVSKNFKHTFHCHRMLSSSLYQW